MYKPSGIAALAFALALTACEDAPPAPVETPAPTVAPAAEENEGAELTGSGEGQVIPARFLGVWDYADGNCNPASDLRMEIAPRRIVFYESVGDVTAVVEDGVNAVLVTMAMSGEGESWQRTMRLDFGADDQTLLPGDADGGEAGQPLPRKKCAA